jgi:hypothetical protein
LTTIGLGSTQTGKIHHPPGVPGLRHEVTEKKRKYNVARISSTEIPWLKFSPRFSKECKEGEEMKKL